MSTSAQIESVRQQAITLHYTSTYLPLRWWFPGGGYILSCPSPPRTGKPRGGKRINGGRWWTAERDAKRAVIVRLAGQGWSTRKIAQLLNASRTTVLYYRRQLSLGV